MSAAVHRHHTASDEVSSPFYFNASHWRAMDGVMEGVRERSGIMVLTGPTGSGKTMLMRAIADDLEDGSSPLFLQYASLNFREFVNFLHNSLNVDDEILDASNKAVALRKFLYAQAERGETAVVFIDEAQNLEPDVLKMLPKLASFDALEDGRTVGLQFVLVGGSELREFLDDSDFDDVRASIARSYELRFFTREELKHFLEKRLAPIARMTPEPITDDAIEAVGRYSGGSPRLIGMICSHAMLFAAEHPGRSIDEAMIEEAAEALMLEPVENAFAHEDDAAELTGPFSSADLKGEGDREQSELDAAFVDDDNSPLEDTGPVSYDDDRISDDSAAEYDAYAYATEDADDGVDAYSNDILDEIGDESDEVSEDLHEFTEDGDRPETESPHTPSIMSRIGSAFSNRGGSSGKADAKKVLGANRRSRNADTAAAPTEKRRLKTRVAGEREKMIKRGVIAAALIALAGGGYMIRGSVIDAVAGAQNAVSNTASRAVETVKGAAVATTEVVRNATESGPWNAETAVVATDVTGESAAAGSVVAALDPAPAPKSSGGWGATITVDSLTSELKAPKLPAPAVDLARGALDLVDRAIDAGSANAPETVRGALQQASNDVASLRKTMMTSGQTSEETLARLEELVAKGDQQFENQLYIAPRGDNAYDTYRAALDIDPENEGALRGIEKLRAFYSTKAENARAAKKWDNANRHFETALAISKLRPVR